MDSITVRTGEKGLFDRLMVASVVAGTIGFLALCISSIAVDGSWILGTNMLSDLGVSSSDLAASLFNASCIFGGLTFMAFSLSKAVSEEGLDRVSGMILMIACALLVMVGIFTEDMPEHARVAWGFCNVSVVALAVSTVSDISMRRWRTILASGAAVAVLLLSAFAMPFPFTEVVMVLSFGVWCMIMTVRHAAVYSGPDAVRGRRRNASEPMHGDPNGGTLKKR